MKIRILGCSGGIGGRHLRTTSLLVDHDILVDAGTGVGDLSLVELSAIDHVFITHTHLDHIAMLPLIVDAVGERRARPLTVHGSAAVIGILRNHLFNWSVWPDFSEIPTPEKPFLEFSELRPGRALTINGRTLTPLPADHTVPAVGYLIDSGEASLAFSGDTGPCPALWKKINRVRNLKALIVECAFSNQERRLADISKHLCPELLAAELAQLERECDIYITHLKPGQIELTMAEIEEGIGALNPRMLQNGEVIEL